MSIRLDQLRHVDLNLLVYFVILVEEKNVSRAAKRLRLTQPAVSRALSRLRAMFQDELLVRVSKGYELTSRGRELLDELAVLLPHVDKLISGMPFDPSKDESTFRIIAADSLAHLYGPVLAQKQSATVNLSFDFDLYREDRYSELEANSCDLVLDADYKMLSAALRKEVLFEDEIVVAVADASPHRGSISLSQYLATEHVGVQLLEHTQAITDITLAKLGLSRHCAFRVSQFSVALSMVAGSNLIATLPKSFANILVDHSSTRLIRPPKEFKPFQYIMVWHKRQDKNVHHLWLRQLIRDTTKEMLSPR